MQYNYIIERVFIEQQWECVARAKVEQDNANIRGKKTPFIHSQSATQLKANATIDNLSEGKT